MYLSLWPSNFSQLCLPFSIHTGIKQTTKGGAKQDHKFSNMIHFLCLCFKKGKAKNKYCMGVTGIWKIVHISINKYFPLVRFSLFLIHFSFFKFNCWGYKHTHKDSFFTHFPAFPASNIPPCKYFRGKTERALEIINVPSLNPLWKNNNLWTPLEKHFSLCF